MQKIEKIRMNGQEQAAQWIWYPGDFEMMLLQRVMVNRYERDVYVPSFWRLDDFYKSVRFIREFTPVSYTHLTLPTNSRV